MPTCKVCGKEIFFALTVDNKRMPCDVKAQKFVHVRPDNRYEVLTGYVPHWATCTDAKRFKKK